MDENEEYKNETTQPAIDKIQTKPQLLEQINKWTALETHILKMNKKIQEYKSIKNALNTNIVSFFKENKLENRRIETDAGLIGIMDKKEYGSLTFSFLEECLNEIVSDKNTVKDIINHFKEKRNIQIKTKLVIITRTEGK